MMAALAKLEMPRRTRIRAIYLEDRKSCILTPLALQQDFRRPRPQSGRHAEYDARIYTQAHSKQGNSEESENLSQTAEFQVPLDAQLAHTCHRFDVNIDSNRMRSERRPSKRKCRECHDPLPLWEREINMHGNHLANLGSGGGLCAGGF